MNAKVHRVKLYKFSSHSAQRTLRALGVQLIVLARRIRRLPHPSLGFRLL